MRSAQARTRAGLRLRALLAAVAVAALALGLATLWLRPAARGPRWDPTGEVLSVEPPQSARFADPYDLSAPAPPGQ